MPQGPGTGFRFQPQMQALIAEVRATFSDVLIDRPPVDELLELLETRIVDRDRSIEDFLSSIPPAPTVYDCYVDPRVASDNVGTKVFKTVASAVNTMYGLGYTTILRIGFIPNNSSIGATDTVAITTWPTFLSIQAIGFDGSRRGRNADPGINVELALWDINSQLHANPVGSTVYLRGLFLRTGQTQFWPSQMSGLVADNCQFYTTNAAGANVGAGKVYLNNCSLVDCTPQGDGFGGFGIIMVESCSFACAQATTQVIGFSTNISSQVYAIDCSFFAGGATNTGRWNFQAQNNIVINPFFASNNASNVTLGFTRATSRNVIHGGGSKSPSEVIHLDCTTANSTYKITGGSWGNVTVAAPAAGNWHTVAGNFQSLDVTGPASIDVGCIDSVTIRGDGVSGTVATGNNGMTYVGSRGSSIVASVFASFAGLKPYAFDAASSRNILIIGGTNGFTVAGTDAGTANRIITNTGAIGAGTDSTAIHTGDTAGGDLAGTFPNPTVAKLQTRALAATAPAGGDVVTWDAAGSTWKPAAPAAGAAEGAGAGTYGNIGVAARVTLDANGHTTAAANVVDFSQPFLMGA